jgi:pSer/pThr/pTyr-binding forkhead associated (FHA) protein
MPTLKLNFKDKSIADYQLQKGVSLTIGRRKNNDVVIENLAVSSHHAKIDSVGDDFVLIDLKSKNGSFVNEQLIDSHWLKQGDVISIGKHSLTFCYSEGEKMPDDASDEFEKTMAMDTSQYRSMMNKSKPKISRHLAGSGENRTVGLLAYLAGGNGEIKLSAKITKIGKHPTSDIIVKGLTVGQTAATISRRPDGFYLSYVEGISKPKVNETTVKRSILLNDLDIIYLGSTKLQFFEGNPRNKMI